MSREKLLRSPEFWKLEIQMDLYDSITEFMNNNNLNRKELADKFGFSKGYISQILNGEFNYSISKMVELALKIDKVPLVKFENLKKILYNDACNLPYDFDPNKNVVLKFDPNSNITLLDTKNDSIEFDKSDIKYSATNFNDILSYKGNRIYV